MMLAELWKGINSNPELGLEHGNGGWKGQLGLTKE
jgi:hypothetical protein